MEDLLLDVGFWITVAMIPALAFFLRWVIRYIRWSQDRIQRAHDQIADAPKSAVAPLVQNTAEGGK